MPRPPACYGRWMRVSLSTRIFAGFLVLLLTFAGASAFAVLQLHAMREDLVLLHRGYLALGRSATQLRTLQEMRDAHVERALEEGDPIVRRRLVAYARDFYPTATRERLDELLRVTRELQAQNLKSRDALFLESAFAQVRRARDMNGAYDEAVARLLESVESGDDEGTGTDGMPDRRPDGRPDGQRDRQALVETWVKKSEGFSRELRGLAVSVDARTDEAVLRADRTEREGVAFVIGIALLAAAIGVVVLVMMLRALRPLRMLVDAARAIGRGALDEAAVPALGNDEVGALAAEFNAMARALKDREVILDARSQELLRLSTFAENVIRSVRIGILVLDGEGRIRALNPAARSVLHLPLIDVEGRRAADLLPSALAPVLDALREVRATGEIKAFPLVPVDDRYVDIGLVPIRDRAGTSSGDVLVLGEDVTAREETRERLLQSERLAAIGRLAAQITHEIRNPLSSVALNIELLGDDVAWLPPERQQEARAILDAVLKEVSRLTEITEGYLRFSRLPAARRVEGDVGDLLADLAAFTQPDATQAGVNVELHVDPDLPAVPFDPARLRQAVLNLLKNALDAAGPGGSVRIGARALDDGGVRILVEDTGTGIPADVRAHLFEPFFTTKVRGTGLGLVVAQEIVREHRGDIAVDDSALGGAAFRIDLPVDSTSAL